jgi:hypothetical protein
MRLLGLGMLLMIFADAVVGIRLLQLARRTRQLPEASLGLSFLLLGAIGYPLSTAARLGALPTEGANAALLGGAFLVQNLGCLGIYVATARIFRSDSRRALAVTALAGAAFAASWVGQGLADGFDPSVRGGAYYLGLVTRATAFAWAAYESLSCWALGRRRLRLGLADPIVIDRFLLFGVATSAVFVAFAAFGAGQLTTANVAESVWVLVSTSLAGVVAAVTTWLAFVPPDSYRRLVLERAAARHRLSAS